jgi:hypothetical protein
MKVKIKLNLVEALGNDPSGHIGNSFTDCPVSLTVYASEISAGYLIQRY